MRPGRQNKMPTTPRGLSATASLTAPSGERRPVDVQPQPNAVHLDTHAPANLADPTRVGGALRAGPPRRGARGQILPTPAPAMTTALTAFGSSSVYS